MPHQKRLRQDLNLLSFLKAITTVAEAVVAVCSPDVDADDVLICTKKVLRLNR